ncbi:MAG: histidine phosphatase family protein [Oligoflexia bacterium]|nr:histidine phosphatase family protein [Oligoflexia bacterium]
MIIYLIRHGQTNCNVKKLFYGKSDVSLNPYGCQEVRALKKFLAKEIETKNIKKIFCSDRARAIESAKILFPHRRLHKLAALCEIDFGLFEGLHISEIEKRYPKNFAHWMKDHFHFRFPQGESHSTFKRRVLQAFREIIQNHHEAIAIVAHGGTISMILNHLFKKSDLLAYLPPTASVTKICLTKKTKTSLEYFGRKNRWE